MGFFGRLLERRAILKAVRTDLEELDRKAPEDLFRAAGPPLLKERDTMAGQSVTGVYQAVQDMVSEAIAQKRKVRDAAQRVSNVVGVTPPPLPRTAKKS